MFGRISGDFCLCMCVLVSGCGKSDVAGDPSKLVIASEEKVEPRNGADPVGKQPADKAPPLPSGGAYQFPDDEGGKILGKILLPRPPAKLPAPPARLPTQRSLPPALSNPEVPFSPNLGIPARLPQNGLPIAKPTALPDRVLLELARSFPEVPAKLVMPEGALTNVPAPDVRQPADLPILAKPTTDRASLEDPTADYSTASVNGAVLPLRQTTAPFVKINLPDPFENAHAAQSRTTLSEDPATALGAPQPPRPQLK